MMRELYLNGPISLAIDMHFTSSTKKTIEVSDEDMSSEEESDS